MNDESIKEELSISYLSTLAAINGIDFELIRHDSDSTDCILKRWIELDDGQKFNAQLRVQLKCTSSQNIYKEEHSEIKYRLKAKNYNDLSLNGTVPVILCLLILPEDRQCWVKWSEEELIIYGKMYWISLKGKESTQNSDSITIHLKKENKIDAKSLYDILEKIAKEEDL